MRWLLIGLVILAAACGGNNDETAGLVDAIADQIEADVDAADSPFSRGDAECIARSYIDRLGMETMEELGLNEAAVRAGAGPGDAALTNDEVADIAVAMGNCVDMAQVMSQSLAYADLSDQTLRCLADAFEGDIEATLMRNTIRYGELVPREDPAVGLAVAEAVTRCVTPQELERLEEGG